MTEIILINILSHPGIPGEPRKGELEEFYYYLRGTQVLLGVLCS